MRLAYLIQAHTEPEMLLKTVSALRCPGVAFFIHVDAKVDPKPFWKSLEGVEFVYFVDDRVRVFWGGWSQVEATLRLIAFALGKDEKYDAFAFISGACFPVRPNEAIISFLEANRFEFLSSRKMPDPVTHKSLDRLTQWTFEGGYREMGVKAFSIRLLNVICRFLPARNFEKALGGRVPHAGSNWWVLTRGAVNYVMDTVETCPSLVDFFRYTKMPDECFFQTILANGPYADKLWKSLTFADWTDPRERPCMIKESHLKDLLNPNYLHADAYGEAPVLFARKFGRKNIVVVERIEAELARAGARG